MSDTFDFSRTKLTPGSGTKIPAVDTSGRTDAPGYLVPSEMPISNAMQTALDGKANSSDIETAFTFTAEQISALWTNAGGQA